MRKLDYGKKPRLLYAQKFFKAGANTQIYYPKIEIPFEKSRELFELSLLLVK